MHFSCLVQDVHRRKWTRLWPFLPRCTPPQDGSLPRFEEQGIIPFVLFIPPAKQTDGTRPAFCLPEFIILDKFPSSRGPIRDASLSDFLRFYRDATRALDDKLDRSRRENFDERVSAFSDRFHARDVQRKDNGMIN